MRRLDRHTIGRALLYVLRAGMPSGQTFPDGVAWATRMILILVHGAFALPTLIRPNTPLLLQSYSAFDDWMPFTFWGFAGLIVMALLWVLPPRVPWGVLSTALSAFYLYLLSNLFREGAGLTSGVLWYGMAGVLSGALMMRALWAWAETLGWFRALVMKEGRRGG